MPAENDPRGFVRRHRVLGCAALATLAASIWALDDAPEMPAPRALHATSPASTVPRQAASTAEAGAVLALALPERGSFTSARRNLFAATTAPLPASAPAAVVAVAPAAAPASAPVVAPPPPIEVPFTFGGRLVTEAGPSVLLNEGAWTRVLSVGASLGNFRFEQDTGTQLVFTHVPSGERIVLALQP